MARQKKTESAEAHCDGLVRMTKDGETIDVHPSCVKAHEQSGWKVVEDQQ